MVDICILQGTKQILLMCVENWTLCQLLKYTVINCKIYRHLINVGYIFTVFMYLFPLQRIYGNHSFTFLYCTFYILT